MSNVPIEKVLDPKYNGQQQMLLTDRASPRVVGGKVRPGEWVNVSHSRKTAGEDRVHKIRIANNALRVVVRVTKPIGYMFEDQRQSNERTVDVEVHIDFSRRRRIAEVYASHGDAQNTLYTFAQWYTGAPMSSLRSRAAQQREQLIPVRFQAKHVENVARKLELANTSARARPRDGQAGELQLWGDFAGSRREPLNSSALSTHSIDKSPKSLLWYNMHHRHSDGYDEHTEVEFTFRAIHPGVTFRQKASRSAMDIMVLELCKELGIE